MKSKNKFELWGSREGHLNMAYYWPVGLARDLKGFLGKGYSHCFIYLEGETLFWYEDFTELRDIGRYLLKKFLRNEEELDNIYHEWRKGIGKFLKRAEELYILDFSAKSKAELLKIYKEVIDLNTLSPLGYFTDIMQMFLQDEVKSRLKKYLPESHPNFNLYFSALVSANNLSLAAQEELDLLEIAKKTIGNKNLLDRMIDGHTKRFFWLGGNYTGRGFFTKEYFRKKIKPLLSKDKKFLNQEINKLKALPRKANREKERVAEAMKIDSEFAKVIKVLEKIIIYHDERKETILSPVFYLIPLEKAIATKLGIKRDELVWLLPREIVFALKTGKVNKGKIQQRSKKCALYYDVKKEILATGKNADRLIQDLVLSQDESGEIKGTVANVGRVEGRVRVIKSVKEIEKVKKGDILVCGMTTPDYVPALKKALAVVTDEGGITCHAAIISRELGIPCIIGTKIATKVLKDGDLVEVDAEQGIVRIIR